MAFLPPEDCRRLTDKGITFEEVEDGAQKGIILRGYSLPAGRFDAKAADILVLLPPGYPDVPPDMFHTKLYQLIGMVPISGPGVDLQVGKILLDQFDNLERICHIIGCDNHYPGLVGLRGPQEVQACSIPIIDLVAMEYYFNCASYKTQEIHIRIVKFS